MIRQNMLNLKQLNAELAALKAQKASFPSLFIISSILSYGHKYQLLVNSLINLVPGMVKQQYGCY